MTDPQDLTDQQAARLEEIESEVREQLSNKPRRLTHVLGVTETAAELARVYGVDIYLARAAALLHDWCKAVPDSELVGVARGMGLSYDVDLELIAPLLHGFIAARILPERFPDLDASVFQAIDRHTLGDAEMTPLDMVLFVADGIEPNRPDVDSIERIRASVGKVSLEELFWMSFASGVAHVIDTGRYLWPRTVGIYN
ncbi:MAG: bis(5'-nucleosyl)-tetraphosphatase (symmetrical) YqeK, partial [Atopobiaceae bacterium]|nr:bis(5'-nucleosyl)-tetraphosphatase (symmetrical) YqeK [Atopobiaceae bacterium]